MTHNSLIFIVAIRTPILVSYEEALEVQKIKEDNNVNNDASLHIGNKLFTKGQVRYVEAIKDGSRSESWNKSIHDDNIKAWQDRKALLRQTPEYRAKELEMFKLLYKIGKNAEPSAETLQKAEVIQCEFFKENPKRTLCDLNLLTPLIPDKLRRYPREWQTVVADGGLRYIENCLLTDMREARKSYDEK